MIGGVDQRDYGLKWLEYVDLNSTFHYYYVHVVDYYVLDVVVGYVDYGVVIVVIVVDY